MLEGNVEHLIRYIYDENRQQSIFGHPEVRIGLVIKLLHNVKSINIDEKLLLPVLKDIERLLENEEYLVSTGDADLRQKCLMEECHFIQKFINVDDNMTLNTEDYQNIEAKQASKPNSKIGGGVAGDPMNQDENTCSLM
jgi:hypothetical protein